MHHFCTYFDRNYLIRGLTLFCSLQAHCPSFHLHVLCLDKETLTCLRRLGLESLSPIALPTIEAWAPDLEGAKKERSTVEYYFTLSPVLPLYLLENRPDVGVITYVDADICFYGDPAPIFRELGDRSILITEHRFPDRLKYMEQKGRFNVQFQSFRRDAQGLACLRRWRRQCVAWCYDRVSGNRFADQKYLDEWPELYTDLVILNHRGSGLGPWNWSQADIAIEDDKALIDGVPLVFYHFHGMKILHRNLISLGMYRYGKMPRHLRRWFYGGYAALLKTTARWLQSTGNNRNRFTYRDVRSGHSLLRSLAEGMAAGQLMVIR